MKTPRSEDHHDAVGGVGMMASSCAVQTMQETNSSSSNKNVRPRNCEVSRLENS